ncbi:MAG: endonuclease [bacterium]|nr:endonuclease [bacterium]
MRFRWILPLLLFLACRPAAEDHRADASRLVLMNLNAEFLWDGVAPEEGKIDFPWKGSREKAEAHMADVAEIIRAHDPDVVHLAEVENRRALDTFNDKFLADSGYRTYFVPGMDTATGQDVALLSRVELEKISRDSRRGRSGGTQKGVSKHYVATLTAGDLRLGLVGIHLLARPGNQSRVEPREAQADAVRRMARDLADRGRSVIVWGDFNDFDDRTRDRSGNRPITRVMEWIRGLDPDDPHDDLFNVTERLPRQQRYTNGRDAIDHVLISPDLVPRLLEVEISHDHDPRAVTNHFPIIIHLRVAVGG